MNPKEEPRLISLALMLNFYNQRQTPNEIYPQE